MKLGKLCVYPCALVVALIASLVGFCSQAHIPEGRAFATIIPLANGYLPATIVGDDWWEERSPTPRVPADLKPAARPSGEKFLSLRGTKDSFPMLGLGLCCRATAYDFHSVSRSVLWYLLKGGRHLDAAYLYMNNEAIGHAIAAAAERGVQRSELFVTSKLGPRFYSGNEVDVEVRTMLKQLGLFGPGAAAPSGGLRAARALPQRHGGRVPSECMDQALRAARRRARSQYRCVQFWNLADRGARKARPGASEREPNPVQPVGA